MVVIGTGGTIAGTAAQARDHVGYRAGALLAQDLLASIHALAGPGLEAVSLAQMDSCDMDHITWVALAKAVSEHLARPEVAGVVVTHGTDTLEETALFLHHTVACAKPVVLTAAMRPASAPSADGPQNLLDAVTVARHAGAQGVVVVFGGAVMAAADARKVHGYRTDAFSSGDAGPVALVQADSVRCFRDWPSAVATHARVLSADPAGWPPVDIVTSHAGARAASLDALVASGARGIVMAGTGNGSLHQALLQAALRAQSQGVVVRRASRCLLGGVVEGAASSGRSKASALPSAGAVTPAQARVELLLDLVASQALMQAGT